MGERTVILSDLHLGRPGAVAVESLRPLWADADHLLINGDVAEVHHPRHWSVAARQTLHLFDLCETDGAELTLLSGNHDPYLTERRHQHLRDGEIFVTHGDALHPAVAPWSPASARMRAAYDKAMTALSPEERDDLDARLSACQHAGFVEWTDAKLLEEEAGHSSIVGMLIRPWAVVKVLLYWRQFPALAATFMAKHAPKARIGVFGHTHHAGVWRLGERVVINTGSFSFPGRPHAVVIEDDTLAFVRIRRRGCLFALDPAPRATFDLTAEPREEGPVANTVSPSLSASERK
jgi:UDP-2,3-diacylglucosamine pyrophosphatase LpxH